MQKMRPRKKHFPKACGSSFTHLCRWSTWFNWSRNCHGQIGSCSSRPRSWISPGLWKSPFEMNSFMTSTAWSIWWSFWSIKEQGRRELNRREWSIRLAASEVPQLFWERWILVRLFWIPSLEVCWNFIPIRKIRYFKKNWTMSGGIQIPAWIMRNLKKSKKKMAILRI